MGDHIWYRKGVKGQWKHIGGRLKQVAVSGHHVWGVNSGDNVYYRKGPNGGWKHIGGKLKQIQVSGNHVWGVNRGGRVWYRKGVNGRWQHIGGSLKRISVDGNNVWGVNSGDNIYYRRGVRGGWRHIGGKLKQIHVAGNRVWGVNRSNHVWYRSSATGGGSWKRVSGSMKHVSSTYMGTIRKSKRQTSKRGRKKRKKASRKRRCPSGFNYANNGYWANVYSGWFGKSNLAKNIGVTACASKCKKQSKCVAFTVWHPTKDKHCYLMSKTVKAVKGKASSVSCKKSIKPKTTPITKKTATRAALVGSIKLAGNTKFCLNLHNFSKRNGGQINLWKCNQHNSQKWSISPSGQIKLSSDRHWCLNLHGYSKRNGGTVNLWKCNRNKSQKWTFADKGLIKLAKDPRWCLNLHGYSRRNGGSINLWRCNGHMSQKWKKPPVAKPKRKINKTSKKVPKDAMARGARKKGGALSKSCKGVCPDVRGLVKELRMAERVCSWLVPHRL